MGTFPKWGSAWGFSGGRQRGCSEPWTLFPGIPASCVDGSPGSLQLLGLEPGTPLQEKPEVSLCSPLRSSRTGTVRIFAIQVTSGRFTEPSSLTDGGREESAPNEAWPVHRWHPQPFAWAGGAYCPQLCGRCDWAAAPDPPTQQGAYPSLPVRGQLGYIQFSLPGA